MPKDMIEATLVPIIMNKCGILVVITRGPS